jgi:hypothetical protein
MKSGNLNLLEPSGPHRACYGTLYLLPICWNVKGASDVIREREMEFFKPVMTEYVDQKSVAEKLNQSF